MGGGREKRHGCGSGVGPSTVPGAPSVCGLGALADAWWGAQKQRGGGARMGPSSMLAGDMLSQVSPLGSKARRVHSVARTQGVLPGTWFLLFLKGSFLGKPRLVTHSLPKSLPSTAQVQNTQFGENTYHACYLDTTINNLLKGLRTKAGFSSSLKNIHVYKQTVQ